MVKIITVKGCWDDCPFCDDYVNCKVSDADINIDDNSPFPDECPLLNNSIKVIKSG